MTQQNPNSFGYMLDHLSIGGALAVIAICVAVAVMFWAMMRG